MQAKRRQLTPYLFIAPNMALFSVFVFFPLLYAFYISLREWSLIDTPRYIGLENYARLAGDALFWQSLHRSRSSPMPSCLADVAASNRSSIESSVFACDTPRETAVGFPDTGKPTIAKAKAVLQEAGYKGEKIVITLGGIASFAPLAPMTQPLLRQIGIPSEIPTTEWGAFLARRAKPDPVAEGSWNLAHAIFDGIDPISPLGNFNFDARGKVAYAGFVDEQPSFAVV